MESYPYPLLPRPQVGDETSYESNVIRSLGAIVKRRQRFPYQTRLVTLRFFFTEDQLAFFRSWYKHKLKLGVRSFAIDLNYDGTFTSYTAHFVGNPNCQDGGKHWNVNATIRIES